MKRFLCLAAGILVLPAIALAQSGPEQEDGPALISFVPQAEAVFVQKDDGNPELGNATVAVQLSNETIAELEDRTGRSDLFAVGPAAQQVVFRDDGEVGDAVKGDGVYTAIAHLDLVELAERSSQDRTNETEGENVVPVFDGREIIGSTEVQPFDFEAFDSGEVVRVERGLSVSGGSAGPQNEEGDIRSASAPAVVPGTNQFQERVLMIRNAAVVRDPLRTFDPCTQTGTPMGPWTFGHLVTEMANQTASGIDPSTFVETWLRHWSTNQNINTFNVPSRTAINALISDWRAASGGGPLNLKIAPFRLLAINPRVDLRTTTGGGGTYSGAASGMFLDAGEARFTFGVILPKGYDKSQSEFNLNVQVPGTSCQVTRFSVIFEYRVPKCMCEHVRDWAKAWVTLDSFVPGTNAYNSLLEKLTRTFTDAGANPTRPNRSAIGQVRSNEIALRIPWEIREFQLRMMPWSFLLETTTADQPHDSFNNTGLVGSYMNDVAANVLGSVPLIYPIVGGNPFLGANPQTPNPATMFWDSNPPGAAGRFPVSLGTCNGCHARETDTIFQHIESFQPAPPAVLSGFLTGITVLDPSDLVTLRDFDDLARREADINAVAVMICGHFQPTLVTAFRQVPSLLRGDGTEVQSTSAAATALPDPDAPALSVAIEDFLREPVQQVH